MKNIYILGSLNTDLVISSPHMPLKGETVTGTDFMTNFGGKGANQAAACAKLGGRVVMGGCVGSDDFGAAMKKNLKDLGVDVTYIKTQKDCASGTAVIILSEGDNRIILSKGANEMVDNELIDGLLSNATEGDVFLVQLENPIEKVGYALEQAKKKSMFTVLNPAPMNKEIIPYLKYVDLITPNETELAEISGGEGILKGAASINVPRVVVTLGSKGYYYRGGEKSFQGSSVKVKAIDTTAAGDTFTGALCVKFAEGATPEDALTFASKAAGIAVTRKGAICSIPVRSEVDNFDYRKQ